MFTMYIVPCNGKIANFNEDENFYKNCVQLSNLLYWTYKISHNGEIVGIYDEEVCVEIEVTGRKFPSFIPARILKGYKEGDIIHFENIRTRKRNGKKKVTKIIDIPIKCVQKSDECDENFETVLNRVIENATY